MSSVEDRISIIDELLDELVKSDEQCNDELSELAEESSKLIEHTQNRLRELNKGIIDIGYDIDAGPDANVSLYWCGKHINIVWEGDESSMEPVLGISRELRILVAKKLPYFLKHAIAHNVAYCDRERFEMEDVFNH